MNTLQQATYQHKSADASELPDRNFPNAHVLEDGHIRWKIENANLIAFGAWLAIGILILCAIGEMNGW